MKLNREIKRIVAVALQEDQSGKDITSRLLFNQKQMVQVEIIVREKGVLCGIEIAKHVFRKLDPECEIRLHARDGDRLIPLKKIMTVKGKASKILSAERTALNFLQHLSGIATLTRKFVDAVKGTKAKIYDTRKTIPGLRLLQKYAVRCGGGQNHRMNLSEMAMVKDNHLKIVESLKRHTTVARQPYGEFKATHDSRSPAVWQVQSLRDKLPKKMLVEIEAQNIDEVELALRAKADIILLDNMTIPQVRKAIRFIRSYSQISTLNSKLLIEVSGGITLRNVRQIARLGIGRISVGAITHSAPAIDISVEIK